MPKHPKVSIIIPTLGRPESLSLCLESIRAQTFKDYEVILVTESGELSKLRNEGAKKAKGDYLVFTDDDVIMERGWLNGIVESFERSSSIGGVSGPSWISRTGRENRDLFRFKFFKWVYDQFFCDGRSHLPGHFASSGAFTTGACEKDCKYEGYVEFLEACNMSYRAELFFALGGFTEDYIGVGEWSEPDLCFRIRGAGYKLWFSRDAKLEHRPSTTGAFKKRDGDSINRMANYELFSKRWIRPCLMHTLYKLFMRGYYAYKTLK